MVRHGHVRYLHAYSRIDTPVHEIALKALRDGPGQTIS